MANKFQMSVQERLELDQKKRKARSKQPPKESDEVIAGDAAQHPEEIIQQTERSITKKQPSLDTQEYTDSVSHTKISTLLQEPASQGDKSESRPLTALVQGDPLTGYLRMTPQRLAKNKTFYLDLDVIEALHQSAQKAGVADSKLANDILRTVFGLAD